MRLYETMIILHPELSDEQITGFIDRVDGIIEKQGGKITEIDQWGPRKLAYRINKQKRGYYTLLTYAADTELINELERNLKIAEECMRFMTVRREDEVDPAALEGMEKAHKKPTPSAKQPNEKPAAEDAGKKAIEPPETGGDQIESGTNKTEPQSQPDGAEEKTAEPEQKEEEG